MLAISIDENGFEIDDQGFNFNNVSTTTLDSTYSFILNGKHILCIGKHIYQYDITKKMWSKLSQQMSQTRVGAACISITDKVIIFGGSENGQVSNAIDVICDDFSISRTFSKLPIPLKFHTVTKISDTELISELWRKNSIELWGRNKSCRWKLRSNRQRLKNLRGERLK